MTPPNLRRIVDLFAGAPKDLRLQALLEYSRKVPPLPEHLAGHRDQMEQVVECQTPFFLTTEVDDDRRVHLFFDVPAEAPTTRGFAGILREGLEGADADEVLATPDDFYEELGLAEVISEPAPAGHVGDPLPAEAPGPRTAGAAGVRGCPPL